MTDGSPVAVTPMFPLGTVLFPHARIPLHVFERRYRTMVEDCVLRDRPFGVVLIERGHEVGGADVRFAVGTLAAVEELVPLPGDRYALVAVGTRRCRVAEWLPDDPHPRARVSVPDDEAPPPPDADERVARVAVLGERALALASELGLVAAPRSAGPLDDDPVVATYQVAARSPLGALDAQRVLEAGTLSDRLDVLEAALDAAVTLLRVRLGSG